VAWISPVFSRTGMREVAIVRLRAGNKRGWKGRRAGNGGVPMAIGGSDGRKEGRVRACPGPDWKTICSRKSSRSSSRVDFRIVV
jgi:hypothetical protein